MLVVPVAEDSLEAAVLEKIHVPKKNMDKFKKSHQTTVQWLFYTENLLEITANRNKILSIRYYLHQRLLYMMHQRHEVQEYLCALRGRMEISDVRFAHPTTALRLWPPRFRAAGGTVLNSSILPKHAHSTICIPVKHLHQSSYQPPNLPHRCSRTRAT